MVMCTRCGDVEVAWGFRDKAGTAWHPPLEHAGMVLIIDGNGVVREMAAYKLHVCDPEKQANWTPLSKEELRAASIKQAEVTRCDILGEAETRPCPKCKAEIDVPCVDLAKLKRNEIVETRWPHSERLELQ